MFHSSFSSSSRLTTVLVAFALLVLPATAQDLDPCFEACHELAMIAYGDDEDYDRGAEVEQCMESFCGGM